MFIVMFEPWHSWMCVDDLEWEKEEKSRRRKTWTRTRSCEDQWAAGRRTWTSRTRSQKHLCVVVVQKSHKSGRWMFWVEIFHFFQLGVEVAWFVEIGGDPLEISRWWSVNWSLSVQNILIPSLLRTHHHQRNHHHHHRHHYKEASQSKLSTIKSSSSSSQPEECDLRNLDLRSAGLWTRCSEPTWPGAPLDP